MDNEMFQGQVLNRLEQIFHKLDQNDDFQEQTLNRFEQISQKLNQNDKFQEQALNRFEQISQKLNQNDKFQEQALIRFEQVFEQLKVLSDSLDTLSVNQEKMQLDITNIRHSQVRMEHDINKKITSLFDFRDSQLKANKEFAERLSRLETK
ncbi:hypothetical protein Desdi_0284 [Desulfitobacterium dichloroeliminans LMG P-21439]|uniref:Uncharacterized protein n=1 Tax=Desulfitobacterium dichloroeliminans (strain LMG P-21439 / DCA1) TaxID=871963 RepID=L0F4G1_DESDL|nr:hypothetical protein [Desulfitobacterium dichloroeliminans]AGA67833.1 hypothetical protein Desdi_0284 [Desulfitobacterium dichloroeliminans LMG P-21439]